MSKKQLRIEAESLGVPLDVIDQFRDDEMTKACFVDVLASLLNRERLASMSKKQLRIEAESLGVPLDIIDQFRDDEMTKAGFVDVLASLSKAGCCTAPPPFRLPLCFWRPKNVPPQKKKICPPSKSLSSTQTASHMSIHMSTHMHTHVYMHVSNTLS